MEIIAHRGASAHAKENTIAAIQKALELGATAIEVDVQRTRDGQLVIYHDHLISLHGQWAFLQDTDSQTLRSLDLGDGLRIPTLDEALLAVAGRARLILDLHAPYTAQPVIDRLQARSAKRWCGVASFLHDQVLTAKQLAPDLETSLTFAGIPYDLVGYLRRAEIRIANLHHGFVDRDLVERLKRAGVAARVYTVNTREEAERFASWGVDAIFSDDPALLR